jgi:hypothetical protein
VPVPKLVAPPVIVQKPVIGRRIEPDSEEDESESDDNVPVLQRNHSRAGEF